MDSYHPHLPEAKPPKTTKSLGQWLIQLLGSPNYFPNAGGYASKGCKYPWKWIENEYNNTGTYIPYTTVHMYIYKRLMQLHYCKCLPGRTGCEFFFWIQVKAPRPPKKASPAGDALCFTTKCYCTYWIFTLKTSVRNLLVQNLAMEHQGISCRQRIGCSAMLDC